MSADNDTAVYQGVTAPVARAAFRQGRVMPTAGIAPGMTQANMIALPADRAWDFLLYAQRNPKACPVLDVIEAGKTTTPLAAGADISRDLPLYRVWRDGALAEEIADASSLWAQHPDLVTFLIGCSFTFETPLQQAGIEIRHISAGCNVPMYRTNRQCRPAGCLQGEMVVSMRPVAADRVADAVAITARYPAVHGAPVHIGEPAALGIRDLAQPDFGDAVQIKPGEIPVFWACGVTPQAAVMASRLPFAISHAPGHMFITDIADSSFHV
ncbi:MULTISPECIES: putative hydro-lyase [Tatumella]|uniref:Putative hydro-lyase ACFP73_12645 n=1 Tax=Tatumella punctata TaxID=399969 RepID=A0ABW1VPF6_9GAMM|nr:MULTISPECIES: putative hydro-lyase [unclassified Tatumella]MBS0856034.1 putative hydro-lyase [Tatumella sp. JGM16]MBS0878093.1 putative hydro-lyase [Tatumella sp. JGM82]MBS0890452.1 putative hydro-lyase [Tatumella sp. JGM94]MBS0894659.1 putative hydro-lyase [Tatumella sp. JGM130]MBS0900908.1 putative hydro-lyase [Tatumella sp. JGM100]